MASSERWGVAKPEPAFFRRICDELEMPAPEIAYVGDRLDNDIGPASAGMAAVFVRRGPWAILQSTTVDPRSVGAAASIESLDELPGVLRAIMADRRSRPRGRDPARRYVPDSRRHWPGSHLARILATSRDL